MQQYIGQDALARRIMSFLNEHAGNAYTVQELVEDRYIYSSRPLIQKGLDELVREGLVRVKYRGNSPVYQVIVSPQKKKPEAAG